MSVFREREVACRACGTRSVQPIALSIHGTRAPAILDEIRAGTFHRFVCAKCGETTFVDGPLLILDFVRPWWVQVYPRAWVSAWKALERDADRRFDESIARDAPEDIRALAPTFARRVTFGMDGLREKLLLRDAGLDDVALETLKLLLVASRDDGRVPTLRVVELFPDALVLLGAPEGPLRLPRERLLAIAADASLADTRGRLGAGHFVDALRISEPGDARPQAGSVADGAK